MKCRICGTDGNHTTVDAREMMYGLGDVHRYFTCGQCGCLQIEDIPADMARYYGPGYYSFRSTQPSGLRAQVVGLRNRYAVLRTGWIGGQLFKRMPTPSFDFLAAVRHALTRESTILDVGCGAGHLVKSLRMAGFANALGVDPFIDQPIDFNARPLVLRATLDDVPGRFDLVMFHHSLEHMPDQHAALRAAHERLNPGGHCIVRVPLSSSQAWRDYGIHWVQLDAPRHFYLHTVDSMKQLADRTGFKCTDVTFDSTAFQFWGSEQYKDGVSLIDPSSYAINPSKARFTENQISQYSIEAKLLNESDSGDQAIFSLVRG